MRSHRWRSGQSGLPESAHGCPELVKHALLVEANGMCRNTTFGSGPTRQSDDLDSEPDYLLRPTCTTRHWPGGTLRDYSAFLFCAQITVQAVGI